MGGKYTVAIWGDHYLDKNYSYLTTYCGQSAFAAVIALVRAKRAGYGCVKFEWR